MSKQHETSVETPVRPLARVNAHVLSSEELAQVAGGWTFGLSNFGGDGDKDLIK